MDIPDDLVAALRAHLTGDEDEATRLFAPFAAEQHPGWAWLVGYVLDEAARRRLGAQPSLSDIVQYVAEIRTREDPADIDPFVAEKMLRGFLCGEHELLSDADEQTIVDTGSALLDTLVADASLTGHQLDDLLTTATDRARSTEPPTTTQQQQP